MARTIAVAGVRGLVMFYPVERVEVPIDNLRGLDKVWRELATHEVLVGVPEAKTSRRPEPGQKSRATNALLAYIHDNGSPLRNIPPRPFLSAGIREGQDKIVAALRLVAEAALRGKPITLDAVGLTAVNEVRAKITRGPFVPLAARTIAARRRKGRRGVMRPLIDTGQLRNAISYVIVRRTSVR